MKRLGIFGGTFNPIHCGHLLIAEEVREEFQLERLIFLPAGMPPHKDDPAICPPEFRYEMVSLAISSNPHFDISDLELRRGEKSYTVDTLEALRKTYPEPTELLFIMGLDQALDIQTWKDPERLFSLAEILVVSRPGYRVEELKEELRERVQFFPGRSIDISSTEIRRRLAGRKSIRYLVPLRIEIYIEENGLYK